MKSFLSQSVDYSSELFRVPLILQPSSSARAALRSRLDGSVYAAVLIMPKPRNNEGIFQQASGKVYAG